MYTVRGKEICVVYRGSGWASLFTKFESESLGRSTEATKILSRASNSASLKELLALSSWRLLSTISLKYVDESSSELFSSCSQVKEL